MRNSGFKNGIIKNNERITAVTQDARPSVYRKFAFCKEKIKLIETQQSRSHAPREAAKR